MYDEHGHGQLPWRVLIRFRDFPTTQILKAGLKETERAYFHALKQALNLLTGSARSFMDLRQHDQESLWQAVESGRFIDSWKVVQTLLSPDQSIHLAPIRIVSTRSHEVRQAPIPWEGTTLSQALDILTAGRAWSKPVVQGIEPPLDSLVKDLVLELSGPDLFLYICCEF